MFEHRASAVVSAPADQVFALFSHFNDFPKFMRHIDEVTYQDDQRSHWVVDVVGRHEWEAENANWIPGEQIGWRSIDGLENNGVVRFVEVGPGQTRVDVTIRYTPPAGLFGAIAESLGAGKRFENDLQEDLTNFARLVSESPTGALDPKSSNYLFHDNSAAWRGETTDAQDATLDDDEAALIEDRNAQAVADRAW